MFDRFADVERVHGLVSRAPLRENLTIVLGQEGLFRAGSFQYAQFLKALFLAPPGDKDIRDVAVRQAARFLPLSDTMLLAEKLTYAGSENREEVLELVDLVLALRADSMNPKDVERLWAAIRKRP